jgi:hypothetical protein
VTLAKWPAIDNIEKSWWSYPTAGLPWGAAGAKTTQSQEDTS